MSRSPLEGLAAQDSDPAPAGLDAYATGWAAINKLLRRGYSWSGHEENVAFLNLRDGRFADVSAVSGFDYPDDARATALVDWDQDGDCDVFLTNRNGPRVRFLRNDQATGNGSVLLELQGVRANRDAIGARVEVTVRDEGGSLRTLARSVRAGEGYLAQSSPRLTFGLGAGALERVLVRWPGGAEEEFAGVEPGSGFHLAQGSGRAERLPRGAPSKSLAPSSPGPPAPSAAARIVLARPLPLPRLELRSSAGEPLGLFGIQAGGEGSGTGKPVVLGLFARECAPCVSELRELAGRSAELAAAGLAFLAVGVDPEGERARASELLEQLRWPFPWAFAEPEALEILDALQGILLDRERRLPLPASFLVDAAGALRALYLGSLPVETLLADRELLSLSESECLEAATPFPGRWMFPALESDADFLEGRMLSRGLEKAAREYARGRFEVIRSSPAELLHDFGRRSAAEGRLDEAADYFRRALARSPEHFESWSDLAIVLHRQEKLVEAIAAYGKALALQPEHADTRFNLALAFLGAGDRPAAERQLRWLKEHGAESAEVLEQALERFGGR